MLNITNEEELLLAVKQSHLKKRATLGGIGSVVSKGEHKRTLRVVVKKVVYIYEPEERCQNGALWKSFREGALTARSSLPRDKCLSVAKKASDPPDVARWNSFPCHFD